MHRGAVAGFALMLVGALAQAFAESAPEILLYRYTDSRGVTVLDRQGVPSEYIGKGYEVLNQQGRVVQVVPPAPTVQEVRQAQAARIQADADAQLLHLYSSVDDVDQARARKLAELDALIASSQGNIDGLATQLGTLQAQAADQERAGRQVPAALLDQMDNLREQQQRLQDDVRRYQATRAQAQSEFARDRARVQQLVGP